MDALVTVATYYDFPAAHLAKTHLESAGIPAFLIDENVLTMDPLLWAAVGGIKVRVRENDVEAARTTLAEHVPGPAGDLTDVDADDTASAQFGESAGEVPARNAADRAAAQPHLASVGDAGADAAVDSDGIGDDVCPHCGSGKTRLVKPRLPFLAILLFGSRARGVQHAGSDHDLAILAAAYLGKTRLIDNKIVTEKELERAIAMARELKTSIEAVFINEMKVKRDPDCPVCGTRNPRGPHPV